MFRRIAAAAALMVLAAVPAGAQDRHKWWADEKIRQEIGLSAEQATKAEEFFQASLPRLLEIKSSLDTLEAELNALIRENKADESVVALKIDAVEQVRGEMSKTRVLMLYRSHRLLTEEQQTRFKAMMDRLRARRRTGEPGR
jgi:Spy/CpxP family protein refolding chaperone